MDSTNKILLYTTQYKAILFYRKQNDGRMARVGERSLILSWTCAKLWCETGASGSGSYATTRTWELRWWCEKRRLFWTVGGHRNWRCRQSHLYITYSYTHLGIHTPIILTIWERASMQLDDDDDDGGGGATIGVANGTNFPHSMSNVL